MLQLGGWGPKSDSKSEPGVESVSIAGPFDSKGAADTPSRHRIFVCRPTGTKVGSKDGSKDEDLCAKKILSTLVRHAYRRPISDGDLQGLMALYKDGRSDGDFETGVGRALQGILVSKEF